MLAALPRRGIHNREVINMFGLEIKECNFMVHKFMNVPKYQNIFTYYINVSDSETIGSSLY